MTLNQATKENKDFTAHMHVRYGKPVFDELAIVSLAEHPGHVLAYIGPRKDRFKKNFLADAGSLRAGLMNEKYEVGDFEFARYGVGTGFESFLLLAKGIYLICNNTTESMEGITKDPRWLVAQVPFVELSDQIRADPLVVEQPK